MAAGGEWVHFRQAMAARGAALAVLPVVLLLALVLLAPVRGLAQGEVSFADLLGGWSKALDRIEQSLAQGAPSRQRQASFRATLSDIRSKAEAERLLADQQKQRNERLLQALGPAPAEGQPAEPRDVRDQRAAYERSVAELKARIAQTEVVVTRVETLEGELSAISRREFLEVLFEPYPQPFHPATLRAAAADTVNALARVAEAPAAWWARQQAAHEPMLPAVLLIGSLALAIVLGLALRRLVGDRFRADAALPAPTYGRRIAAVIADTIRRGAVPMAVLAALLYQAKRIDSILDGLLQTIAVAGALALMLVVATAVLARTILVPAGPQWRIVALSGDACRRLERGVTLLAVALAGHAFLRVAIGAEELGVSAAFVAVMALIVTAIEAALIVRLMRRRVWQGEPLRFGDGDADAAPAKPPRRFWDLLRPLVSAVAVLGVVASGLGYPGLGLFVVGRLCVTGLVVGAYTIMRGLLREVTGMAFRARLLRDTLEFTHRARTIAKFWTRALLDIALLVLLATAIAIIWNAPVDDVLSWTRRFYTGFAVGQVRVSIGAIATALLIFLAGAFVTRLLQRGLRDHVLPQTQFDAGVQNSLASGFGYVGFAVAIAIAVAAAGIDLTNFALIAGALSVGIGFGLQNVVNNFVSGLILLIERPVKVGDWIVINGNEGYVKTISVRATELETFQRASVIIPNADILSNAVQNWTHKDRAGRIDLAVGVAYGSDVERVRAELLAAADEHERVSKQPEPQVLFMDFGDSSLNFELRCFTPDILYRLIIASDLRFDINRRFAEAGIEIPFPQRVVHLAGGSRDGSRDSSGDGDDVGER